MGVLVIRSDFLPRLLGVWLILAGLGWMLVSLTGLLVPENYERVFSITSPVRLGEVAFLLWLIIMGAKDKGTAKAAPQLSGTQPAADRSN